jgi:uncharacterized protein (TIGR00290 family)
VKKRTLLSWSSGKDSAWTLHVLRKDPTLEVVGLLTTVNTEYDRVAMHATRRKVLEAQSRAVGLPLHLIPLPWPCSNEVYEAAQRVAIEKAVAAGVTHVAFGDLFLREIRAYRERQLAGTGLEPLFPLWGEPTAPLARRMVEHGLEAYVVCVDPNKLSPSFAGRRFDRAFLADLPAGIDPCGENGEFHTCVVNGPGFRERVQARMGEVVTRGGFVFADVVPKDL